MRKSVAHLQNVSFSHEQHKILRNISLQIPKGKIVAIMGPSGTGKSTLLKLMTGQYQPNHGKVTVMGKRIDLLSGSKLYQYRRSIGVLLQQNALFNGLSVFENIAFPLREIYDLPEEIISALVKLKLECVGLRGAIDFNPDQLSGGMARRVALARAIICDPKLMFYDEPFTGQDPITRVVLMRLIKR
jgi:phospholipid/cholesterol/gamma-HCH transport system ATP-binding protein